MDTILVTIKKMLGIQPDYRHFDTDVSVLINSALFKLMQLAVGPPEGFRITIPVITVDPDTQEETVEVESEETWDEFLIGRVDLEAVKSYIYMDVRLIFDAPTPHYVATAMTDQVKELGWRLNVQAEGGKTNG